VVPDLGRVVVDAAGGFLDDFLQRHALEFGAFLQIVEVGHIRVVVLAVVILQRLPRVMRRQRIDRERKRGQYMFHGFPLVCWSAEMADSKN
jgi:hypothetical protein